MHEILRVHEIRKSHEIVGIVVLPAVIPSQHGIAQWSAPTAGSQGNSYNTPRIRGAQGKPAGRPVILAARRAIRSKTARAASLKLQEPHLQWRAAQLQNGLSKASMNNLPCGSKTEPGANLQWIRLSQPEFLSCVQSRIDFRSIRKTRCDPEATLCCQAIQVPKVLSLFSAGNP
jgi:hypothetical protein